MLRKSIVKGALLSGTMLIGGCARTSSTALQPSPCDASAVEDAACVNVGYGVQPRRTVAGSVSTYVPTDNERAGVGRFEQLLEGRMPGVTVERVANGDYSIHVRGSSSGVNGGEPLIVIDGMVSPLGVSTRTVLSSIAPESVARIDVLKDGGSTAIYGSRGANGVILITMKR